MKVASCSIVGFRNSGAVSRMKSFQNWPASGARPSGSGSAGGARSTRSSMNPSGSSRPAHDASAAKTTRCPWRRRTSPIPMQLFVGPNADSGMNRTVRGSTELLVFGGTAAKSYAAYDWPLGDRRAPGDRLREASSPIEGPPPAPCVQGPDHHPAGRPQPAEESETRDRPEDAEPEHDPGDHESGEPSDHDHGVGAARVRIRLRSGCRRGLTAFT